MSDNYTLKYFSSKAYGEDALGDAVMMKSKSEKWKNTKFCALTTGFVENYENVRNLNVYEDDVFLLGFPRSGTTLMQEMIWLIVNEFDFLRAKSSVTDMRFPFLEYHKNIVEILEEKSSCNLSEMPRPRTLKTHLPIQFLPEKIWNIKPKLIHISRDPRDVAVSLFHFTKNLWRSPATIEEFMDEFMNDRAIYCPYDEHVLNYLNLKDDKILHLTYEWVTANIGDAIKKVANFLEKEISEENFEKLKDHLKFDSMKNNDACNNKAFMEKMDHKEVRDMNGFIRKGIVGGYKNELSAEYIEKFDQWIKRKFP